MTASSAFIEGLAPRRRAYILAAAAVGVVAASPFAQDPTAYFYVAIPALMPLLVWLRMGAPGIPVLPAISGLFVIYYALPILRPEMGGYGPEELESAALAVGGFLLAAAVGSLPFLLRARRRSSTSLQSFASGDQIVLVVFVGLGAGIIYNLASISGDIGLLGPWGSVVRAAASTSTSVACYLLGSARGSGLLVGQRWLLGLACLCLLAFLSLSNLLLVGGITNLLAALFGYVIAAKRIPWIALALAFALASILQAGKYEIRRTYWAAHTQNLEQTSLLHVPGILMDWFAAGIATIGTDDRMPDLLERTSLLHMVLLVQRATPAYIPYLEGDTYALLPSMLIPRFLAPDKLESQAVLNLLSVRYGLQHVENTANTTIGWGMVAEAYANFGFAGVIGVGFLFGAFCGFLMRLSSGATPLSLPMFITIAATITLLNVEMDFSYLAVTLAQTMAVVAVLAVIPRVLPKRRPQRLSAAATGFASTESTLRDAHGA